MIFKHGIVVVSDGQLSGPVDLEHVVSSSVVYVVQQSRKQHSGEPGLGKIFTKVGNFEHVVGSAHYCHAVLEVVKRVIVLAVVLVHLRDELAEGVRIDFVGFYYFCVREHGPNVFVLHFGVGY